MREIEMSCNEADATQRYKTALGRALLFNLENGIAWKLDARGKLEPVRRSFVGGPISDNVAGSPRR